METCVGAHTWSDAVCDGTWDLGHHVDTLYLLFELTEKVVYIHVHDCRPTRLSILQETSTCFQPTHEANVRLVSQLATADITTDLLRENLDTASEVGPRLFLWRLPRDAKYQKPPVLPPVPPLGQSWQVVLEAAATTTTFPKSFKWVA